jgi:hypothetical protein
MDPDLDELLHPQTIPVTIALTGKVFDCPKTFTVAEATVQVQERLCITGGGFALNGKGVFNTTIKLEALEGLGTVSFEDGMKSGIILQSLNKQLNYFTLSESSDTIEYVKARQDDPRFCIFSEIGSDPPEQFPPKDLKHHYWKTCGRNTKSSGLPITKAHIVVENTKLQLSHQYDVSVKELATTKMIFYPTV